MVPAYPLASQASRRSAWGGGLGSVMPQARKPSSSGLRLELGGERHAVRAGHPAGSSVARGGWISPVMRRAPRL